MIVLKFGGSSLSTAGKIRRCIEIVSRELEREPIVVVSAHGGMTDCLLEAARKALAGGVDTENFETFHFGLVDALGVDRRLIEGLVRRLETLLHGVSLIGELTPRTTDHVMSFGERLASVVMAAALTNEGIAAASVSAWDIGLYTDSSFGCATPLDGIEEKIAGRLGEFAEVPVITGFIAKDREGSITTLGRSGSDYTASIIGASVGAEEIQIWTDVDGVMTADPSVCADARNLPVLSFNEASELATYGAEVLHPSTLLPAVRKNIPVKVANTARPEEPGTRIVIQAALSGRLAKSIVYKENLCLISLVSHRFLSTAGFLTAALSVLAKHGIDIHIAATSHCGVSFVTARPYESGVLEPAAAELGGLGEVAMEMDKAVVCVVGEELRGNHEVLGKVFKTLGESGINARMVSQSASEINVAFLVDNAQIDPAVTALHGLIA
ncbi:MAG: aspartate kinase [Pseudomonadota bacterium]